MENNTVKEYKGVNIYVSTLGKFYCDAINNSNDYNDKTFISDRLQSIEKAIDKFNGQGIDNGNQFYDIVIYNTKINLLKIVKKIGTRLFFDNGEDTSHYSLQRLYPKSVDKTQHFKEIELYIKGIKENQEKISKLAEIQRGLKSKAESHLRLLSKVIVE